MFSWQGYAFKANHSAYWLVIYIPPTTSQIPVRKFQPWVEKCWNIYTWVSQFPEFLLRGVEITATSFVLIPVKNFSNLILWVSPEVHTKTDTSADSYQQLSTQCFCLHVGWREGLEDEDYLLIPTTHLALMCFHTLSRPQTHQNI